MIDLIDKDVLASPIEKTLGVDAPIVVIMNFDYVVIKGYSEMVSALLGRSSCSYAPKKLYLYVKSREIPPNKLSIVEPSILDLNALLSYFCYTFLGPNNTMLVIIATDLLEWKVEALISAFSGLKGLVVLLQTSP